MVSDHFPNCYTPLFDSIKYGIRKKIMDKPQILNPREITEINFSPGRHAASPSGNVVIPSNRDIGFNYLNSWYSEQIARLGLMDISKRWGHNYLLNETKKSYRCLEV
jgi:hypothetical protein